MRIESALLANRRLIIACVKLNRMVVLRKNAYFQSGVTKYGMAKGKVCNRMHVET